MLEVVTEAEIAEHFKEGVMPRGIAYIFEIVMLSTCAYAALRGRCALVSALLFTKKDVLELHHTAIGEE